MLYNDRFPLCRDICKERELHIGCTRQWKDGLLAKAEYDATEAVPDSSRADNNV